MKITQTELGELIGKKIRTIQEYEKGTFTPGGDALLALQKLYAQHVAENTSSHGLYAGSIIRLDEDLINRDKDLTAMAVYINENLIELIESHGPFKILFDRIGSIARRDSNLEKSADLDEKSEGMKSDARNKLKTPESK